MDGFFRNQWSTSAGISGRFAPELVADLAGLCRMVRYGDRRETAMKAICCTEDEEIVPAHLYPPPDEFDDWIENARQTWVKIQEVKPQRLQIICTMALIPKKAD